MQGNLFIKRLPVNRNYNCPNNDYYGTKVKQTKWKCTELIFVHLFSFTGAGPVTPLRWVV